MLKEYVVTSIKQAGIGMMILSLLFIIAEPAIGEGATTDSRQFTISQTVGKELSFITSPVNVVMAPTLGGITGGTAVGSTQFAIYSNSTAGYQVTLVSSSTVGQMIGVASSSNNIPGYTPASPLIPDYNFTIAANKAEFGYTVEASTTSDVGTLFHENGAVCNSGTDHTNAGHCWLNASSTPVVIVNRPGPTFSTAASTTLKFQVTINANPNPIIPNDTYVATTTLTATTN